MAKRFISLLSLVNPFLLSFSSHPQLLWVSVSLYSTRLSPTYFLSYIDALAQVAGHFHSFSQIKQFLFVTFFEATEFAVIVTIESK